MGQYVFLIRHGKPLFPDNKSFCIGSRTDVPLCDEGMKQTQAWIPYFDFIESIYCSPLLRSKKTAEIIASGRFPVQEMTALREINVGLWEGKSFQEIRRQYPDLYQKRGDNWAVVPLGAETLDQAADRMQQVVLKILAKTAHNAVVVTHEGSIRALMYRLMRLNPRIDVMFRQPYGSVTVLNYTDNELIVTAVGKLPDDSPSIKEIHELWDDYGTPVNVREHCLAVWDECWRISNYLLDRKVFVSQKALHAAALLHDLCRSSGRVHPQMAATILRERGYMKVAKSIEQHHCIPEIKREINEASILYLADKRVCGNKKVTLEERFASSWSKCLTAEAKINHQKQYNAANRIQRMIEQEEGKP